MSTFPESPRQAYDRARAIEQKNHIYTTEGIHVVCSCTYVGTTETIAKHIEDMAEAAGVGAREKVIAKRVAEHEAAEAARKKAEAAALAEARKQIAAQDSSPS